MKTVNVSLVGVGGQGIILTADILAKMENAEKVVKKGGYLIMSGIIDKFEKPLLEKFLKKGFTLEKRETDGIWVGLLLKNA